MTVPDEVTAVIERWPQRAQRLFVELMEDASSELQQELVQRAVLAGHTPGEVHAFADELRGLSDADCYASCTLDEDAPDDYTVAQLLRAESDPLFAFELKGGTLSPNEDDDVVSGPLPALKREVHEAPGSAAQAADPVRRAKEHRAGFTADSGAFRPHVPAKPLGAGAPPPSGVTQRPLGAGAVSPSGSTKPLGAGPVPPSGAMPAMAGGRLLDDLLTEATRGLGVSWREVELDVPGGLTIEQALQQAGAALQRGVPVPCVIGNAQGRPLRFLLVLQLSVSGANRAFQLYEPFSQELVWANERDLVTKGELPFDNKSLRRLLRVALPTARGL